MNTERSQDTHESFARDELDLNPTPKSGELSDEVRSLAHQHEWGRVATKSETGSGGAQRKLTETEMLDAGPNDEITRSGQGLPSSSHYGDSRSFSSARAEPATMSTLAQERDSSSAKLTVRGPECNLTGTPLSAGMQEIGHSLADSSTLGAAIYLTPICDHRASRACDYENSANSSWLK
ncbi:hypothetical protein BU16DRAFT_587200 [Lophium mytilinum]|uniref:Uncharacterized protein n=1 Tax=Lophium mytilinum TaxID=390894 RepID=A0A6A6RE59_9PEZI|nr:hypothetical protein BU16DRAFT_587200 [Lophium mytilinum]